MKFYAFLLFIVLCTASAFGQTIALSNEKQNIVIIGIDNPLTIVVEGYSCKSLIVSTNNGTISGYDNGSFVLIPDHYGEALITIEAKTSKGLKKLGVKCLRAKYLPPPTVYLFDKYKGTISAKYIHHAIAPIAVMEKEEICGKFQITDFTVQVLRNDKIILTKQIHNPKGARFNDDSTTQKMIETVQPNDMLIIKDVICIGPSKKYLSEELNSINLTITE